MYMELALTIVTMSPIAAILWYEVVDPVYNHMYNTLTVAEFVKELEDESISDN